MVLLLNIVFGLLAGYLAMWLTGRAGAPQPVAVIVGVLAGIIVFMLDFGTRVIT